MAGSIPSSDGSGVEKNSFGERDDMVMLYAMSSLSVQSLPDLAVRMTLAIVDFSVATGSAPSRERMSRAAIFSRFG